MRQKFFFRFFQSLLSPQKNSSLLFHDDDERRPSALTAYLTLRLLDLGVVVVTKVTAIVSLE